MKAVRSDGMNREDNDKGEEVNSKTIIIMIIIIITIVIMIMLLAVIIGALDSILFIDCSSILLRFLFVLLPSFFPFYRTPLPFTIVSFSLCYRLCPSFYAIPLFPSPLCFLPVPLYSPPSRLSFPFPLLFPFSFSCPTEPSRSVLLVH